MIAPDRTARIDAAAADFADKFEREPFGFTHGLSDLDILSLDRLTALARRYRPADAFVAAGAATAATAFYSVAHDTLDAHEALGELDRRNWRVLLKRPEHYDTAFRALLFDLFASIAVRCGRPLGRVARLQSSILISSSATITPFHFDPEVSFFFQIAGPKTYHVYSPAALVERELERFYQRGVVDIAQVDLGGRDPRHEHVFELGPGKGMHQPRNAPHWVQTQAAQSISYVISYETTSMRSLDRTRAFNFYYRKLGGRPAAIAAQPRVDAVKASTMRVAMPLRNAVVRAARRLRRS